MQSVVMDGAEAFADRTLTNELLVAAALCRSFVIPTAEDPTVTWDTSIYYIKIYSSMCLAISSSASTPAST